MTVEINKEYQWNPNFRNPIAHTDINLIVSELNDIQEIRGTLNAELVLESAKNKKSVLHSYFQWDNEKAANTFRLRQAAELLTRIEVKIIKDGEPKIFKAFELVKRGDVSDLSVYKKYNTLNADDIEFVKKYCIADLKRVVSRLSYHLQFKSSVDKINIVINELGGHPEEKKSEIFTIDTVSIG